MATARIEEPAEEWLAFKGRAERAPHGWTLIPEEDRDSRIEMLRGDVAVAETRVSVRLGATAIEIVIGEDSPANIAPHFGSAPTCAGGRSRCAGGIEWCCGRQIAGLCHGSWNLCGSSGAERNKTALPGLIDEWMKGVDASGSLVPRVDAVEP